MAALLGEWAEALGLPAVEATRWRAAGHLHDALKGADSGTLRRLAGDELAAPLLHGVACAARLREEGVTEEPLLLAIGYHTTGHPRFTRLGEYLYLADFLDPGRRDPDGLRASLRDRLPVEHREVLLEVTARRIGHLLDARLALVSLTVEFWNRLVGERRGEVG